MFPSSFPAPPITALDTVLATTTVQDIMLPDTIGGPTGIAITDDPIGGIDTGDITAGIGINKSSRSSTNYIEVSTLGSSFKR